MELPDLPEGWKLKSLIDTGEERGWSVFCYSSEEYCQAYGSSPRYAMLDAIQRIADGAVHEVLSGHSADRPDILDILQIKPAKKKETSGFVRRC